MGDSNGRFVWYDVMTTEVAATRAFYTEVIGWKTQLWQDGDYEMWCVGERPIGGLMELPEEAVKMGAPPHWLAYTEVADVAAATARAEQLGGQVLKAATDIPDVGCFAVLRDPQGAVFAVYAPGKPEAAPADKQPGDFTWHELNTTDYEAAWTFYSELFGWQATEAMDMGPDAGTYFMFKDAASDGSVGGMSNMATAMGAPPHWLYYVTVDDLDAAVQRIEAKGGKVLNGPMDVPGGDRVAQCRDPQGIAFAIHWRKP